MSMFSEMYKHMDFREICNYRSVIKNILSPVHFQHFNLFYINFMAILGFEKMLICTLTVHVLYTYENVNIIG